MQLGGPIVGQSDERAGWSVDLSSNGNRVAVSFPNSNKDSDAKGHVAVYQWNGNSWGQVGEKLQAKRGQQLFGNRIAMSDDGNILSITSRKVVSQVGQPLEEVVSVEVFSWQNGVWNQIGQQVTAQAGPELLHTVDISSDGSAFVLGVVNEAAHGFVQRFELNNTSWVKSHNDLVGDQSGDYFGQNVVISTDGTTVAVGAPRYDGDVVDVGRVQVFRILENGWEQIGQTIIGVSKNGFFGGAVSLARNGQTLVVGAERTSTRAFDISNGTWRQIGDEIAKNGNRVATTISSDGQVIVNGAAYSGVNGHLAGQAGVYRRQQDTDTNILPVSLTVLREISQKDGVVLGTDDAGSYYVSKTRIKVNGKTFGNVLQDFTVDSAEISGRGNTLLVSRTSSLTPETKATNRLLADDFWRINGLFDSLQNESSQVLDLSAREISGTLNIAAVSGAYEVNSANNPTLIVRRGQTYTLNLDVAGHPFYLQTTDNGYQSVNVYQGGFNGNGQISGEHKWVVPQDAPDEIFYQCEFHPVMFGKIIVVD